MVEMADRARLILRIPGTPDPETVRQFEERTGATLFTASRIFGAVANESGTNRDEDGVELIFQGLGAALEMDTIYELLDQLNVTGRVNGSDITDRYKTSI